MDHLNTSAKMFLQLGKDLKQMAELKYWMIVLPIYIDMVYILTHTLVIEVEFLMYVCHLLEL